LERGGAQLEIFLWDTLFVFGFKAMLLPDEYGTRPDFDHESESEYEEEEEEEEEGLEDEVVGGGPGHLTAGVGGAHA
jgi:hypothetical protein